MVFSRVDAVPGLVPAYGVEVPKIHLATLFGFQLAILHGLVPRKISGVYETHLRRGDPVPNLS